MDLLIIVLRLVHVVFGALWVGMAVFTAIFLMPAVQEVGPGGGKVMAALQRRGIMTVMPVLALGTLVTGLWLYWRVSAGLQSAYLTSGPGAAFGLGGLAALAAYAMGMLTMRPAMMRVADLSQRLGEAATDADRTRVATEIQRLRVRASLTGRLVAWLLVFSVSAMAVARYL